MELAALAARGPVSDPGRRLAAICLGDLQRLIQTYPYQFKIYRKCLMGGQTEMLREGPRSLHKVLIASNRQVSMRIAVSLVFIDGSGAEFDKFACALIRNVFRIYEQQKQLYNFGDPSQKPQIDLEQDLIHKTKDLLTQPTAKILLKITQLAELTTMLLEQLQH